MRIAEESGAASPVVAVVGARYADYSIEADLIPGGMASLRIASGATRDERLQA